MKPQDTLSRPCADTHRPQERPSSLHHRLLQYV